jgi:hypothetical protein
VQVACHKTVLAPWGDGTVTGTPYTTEFKKIKTGGGSNCCDAVITPAMDGSCRNWSGSVYDSPKYDIACDGECSG